MDTRRTTAFAGGFQIARMQNRRLVMRMPEASTARHLSRAPAMDLPPWQHPAWPQAMKRLAEGLADGRIVALVGLPGVGKSALLEAFAAEPANNACLYVPDRRLTGPFLVDDAHHLLEADLARLVARRQGLVLAGPYALLERLAGFGRGLVVLDLAPLRPEDRVGVLMDMLERSGEPPGLLPPSCMAALGRQSGGRIGPLLAMTKLAIFLARLEGSAVVALHHVEQAGTIGEDVEPLENEPDASTAPRRRRTAGGAALAVSGGLAVAIAGAAMVLSPPQHGITSSPVAPRVVLAELPIARLRPPAPATPALAATQALVLPPTTLPPLPVVPFHVAIHVPPHDPPAFQQGVQLAVLLQEKGYAVSGPIVAPAWTPPSVSYYFNDDADAAAAVAAALDGRLGTARQIDRASEIPRPGEAEIMLPSTWHSLRPTYKTHPRPQAEAQNPVLSAPMVAVRAIAGAWHWVGHSLR